MSRSLVVELRADCEVCNLEGGVVERYDASHPASHFGVPSATECWLCLHEVEAVVEPEPASSQPKSTTTRACPVCGARLSPELLPGQPCAACGARAERLVRRVGQKPVSREHLEARLAARAVVEGFRDLDDFVRSVLVDGSVDSLLERLERGERIEVVADPFDLGRARVAPTHAGMRRRESPRQGERLSPQVTTSLSTTPSVGDAPPRAVIYPLVSVIAADGEIHPKERALVDAFLASEGLAPLADEEIAVHPPEAVARFVPIERRSRIVELMCEAAMIDGMPDGSEKRIVHAYAAAWGVPADQVDAWAAHYHRQHASRLRSLWLVVRHYLLVAPWERADTDRPAAHTSPASGPLSERDLDP